ncbi:MAG TPA: class I SAM-dependent methyltransferase [Niabella sp.]|nr:class I SAM-dependent methyltransferase [Niabella sp.]
MKKNHLWLSLLFLVGFVFNSFGQKEGLDVPYVPTPPAVVNAMLDLAKVNKNDVIYDLGCGDGRIIITAAKLYGATGTGVDIDPDRIAEANASAKKEGVTDKVKFVKGNLFNFDFSKASVLTLYLLPTINEMLKPKILSEMKPGSRVVSHAFSMGDWTPDKKIEVDGKVVYLWTVPAKK